MIAAPAKIPLSEFVRERILERLQTRALLPGDLLNRRQIAAELKVSVAPVLEACVSLEQDGFLETLPRKGTRVRVVRPEDVRGLLLVREALECQAARQACGEPMRGHRAALDSIAKRLDGCRTDDGRTWKLELQFHSAVVAVSGIPELVKLHAAVVHLGWFFAIATSLPANAGGEMLSSHATLIARLCEGDPVAAESAMREHLRSGRGPLLGEAR